MPELEPPNPRPESSQRDAGEHSDDSFPLTALVIREFIVDFLGSLVPGFLFTMFAAPMVVLTSSVILRNFLEWRGIVTVSHLDWKDLLEIPTQLKFSRPEIFTLTLVLAYVLGSIISRRDPKVPDQKSVAILLWKDWNNRKRAVVQPRNKEDEAAARMLDDELLSTGIIRRPWIHFKILRFTKRISKGEGGQFPYSHLKEYLEARGLDHLAERVPWSGNSMTTPKRSKMFINILKIRLQQWNARHCGEIIRNEAHIRMMSSVWFAARLLQQTYIALILLLILDATAFGGSRTPSVCILSFALLILVFATGWVRIAVLTFLHYQRVREIVYVLENAHVAWMSGQRNIFKSIEA